MADSIPFDARRFQSSAIHYFARPRYAPRVFDKVAALCGLMGEERVLDLGCGPGVLSLALAPKVGSVVAVDPEPEMLALLEKSLGDQAGKITLIQGSSNDLGSHWGTFNLAVMGRSFHWMDRAATVRHFETILEPDGAAVLFDTSRIRGPDNQWVAGYHEILSRYGNGTPAWRQPNWIDQEAILLDSAFSDLQRISVVERSQIAAETLVDRAFSMSGTAPSVLGPEKVERMAAEIAAFARKAAVEGRLTEILETSALIARRPPT